MSIASAPQGADGPGGLVVACVQMKPRFGDKAHNVQHSLRFVEQAAKQGARLVVLPELSNTGYAFATREEAFALAEPVAQSETIAAWSEACAHLRIHLVAGFTEREGPRLFNSAVVLGPQGLLATYRKLHLWGDEHLFFEPGDRGLVLVPTEFGRIAPLICYDGWFPEMYRLLAAQGADLVCMPTNWVPMPGQPEGSVAMANTLAMANAHANGLAIACADRVGTERGQPFIGRSLIVGADGWPLAGPASAEQEEILLARIDLHRGRRGRQLNAFNHVLRDRRGDVYQLTPSQP